MRLKKDDRKGAGEVGDIVVSKYPVGIIRWGTGRVTEIRFFLLSIRIQVEELENRRTGEQDRLENV